MTMKKILLSFLALGGLLFASSCQMDEPDAGTLTGEVDFSITAGIPSGITTYSPTDGKAFSHLGGINNVTSDYVLRFILEVYDGEAVAYTETKYLEYFSSPEVTFNPRLLAKEYDFVFWADFVEKENRGDLYYNTSNGLTAISYKDNVTGSDLTTDLVDAYYAKEDVNLTQSSQSLQVTLRRPFGKIRLLATDNPQNQVDDDLKVPTSATIAFTDAKVPTTFNARTGEASEQTLIISDYTFTAKEETDPVVTGHTDLTSAYLLGQTYFFESPSSTAYNMTVTVRNGDTQIGYRELTNIPVSANKLTTVFGNFYTNEGNIEVVVEDKFGDGEVIDAPEVISSTTLADAQAELNKIVLEAGGQEISYPVILNITAEAATTDPETFTLSEKVKDITLVFSAGATNTVTITEKEGETFNGQVTIKNKSENDMSIVVDVPNGSAVLEGSYSNVTATTADNTLIIAENATVDKLSLNKGNVEVYGQLTALSGLKPSGSVITRHISTADAFISYCRLLNKNTGTSIYGKVVLDADIDLANSAIVTSNVNNVEIDGQGHAISNYTVRTDTQSAGLFCDAVTVTVKNLILKNAKVTAINDGEGNAYAGALFGRTYGTIIVSNVKVIDPVIEGVNKVGGLVGFVAENHIEATDCSVDGGSITTSFVDGESGQIGGLIGYLGSLYESTCSISGCSVENTTINAYMTREDRTISKFIGCFQGNQASDILSIDNCHVTNVTLNALDDMAKAHFSLYGDMLGGQRYGKGTVNITNCDNSIYINSAEQLRNIASVTTPEKGKSLSGKTVKLSSDIDLSGPNWEPWNCFSANNFVFDGQGHTINNMSAINTVEYGNGFFSNIVGGTVKNVSFKGALVSKSKIVNYSGNCYGIVTGYTYGTVLFENVHVINSMIYGYGKVGGIVGMAADKGGITTFTNCSVENTSIGGVYNNGGLIGLAQNEVSMNSTSVINVEWDKPNTETYIDIDETIKDNDTDIAVKGMYWKYDSWYYAAWGYYYTDYYYADKNLNILDGYLADGMCHNK